MDRERCPASVQGRRTRCSRSFSTSLRPHGSIRRSPLSSQAICAQRAHGPGAMSSFSPRPPDSVLSFFLDELATPRLDSSVTAELASYLRATGAWTGSDVQLQSKAPGLGALVLSRRACDPTARFVGHR